MYDKELVTNIVDPSIPRRSMSDGNSREVLPQSQADKAMHNVLKALENPLKVVRTATSSRGSWSAALFGSWRQGSSAAMSHKAEGSNGFKQSGMTGSIGSGRIGSLSNRRHSKEIFPEPLDMGRGGEN